MFTRYLIAIFSFLAAASLLFLQVAQLEEFAAVFWIVSGVCIFAALAFSVVIFAKKKSIK